MRSIFLPPLLGLAIASMLPAAALAQDYTPIRKAAQFDPLPIEGTSTPVTILNTGTSDVTSSHFSVQIPFVFWFYGLPFNQVNMSAEGYVTFGPYAASGTQGHATQATNQEIPTTAAPTGLVAPWWDDFTCQPKGGDGQTGSMKAQTFGEPGQQVLVLEWNCTKSTSVSYLSYAHMQLWLHETPSTIQVFYGDRPSTASTHTATVGLENPATYDLVGNMLTTGGTRGTYGLLKDDGTPACTTSCGVADWPAHTMIQFGRPQRPDLKAGRLRFSGLDKGETTISAVIENTIRNGGTNDAFGVNWDHYLSEDNRLDESDLLLEGCRHDTPETVPGSDGTMTASTMCTFRLPESGSYRFCTRVDPDNVIMEASKFNNSWCSDPFVIGSDLVGHISIDPESGIGSRTPVYVFVSNAGTDPTGQFEFTVIWKDCDGEHPDRPAYTGTLRLGGGEFYEDYLGLYLDSTIKPLSLCAELVIDKADDVDELFEDNNIASTCVDPGRVCTVLLRPDLRVDQLRADMPHGCFFDDPFDVEVEICNDGPVPASNFGIIFNFDGNTTVTTDDTLMLSIPETCAVITDRLTGEGHDDPLLCTDLGGGPPTCIRGVCHPPCTDDSHCGGQGLQCLDDPLLEVDGVAYSSCQWALSGGECKRIRAPAIVPAINTRAATREHPDGIPFTDGGYYVGAILDWIGLIVEDDKGNNKMSSETRLTCWTQRPDLEAVELRSVSPIGAGEPFPVYRKVRNNGVVGSPFSYRYVLSSNETPSKFDVPLEVLRNEGGHTVQDRTAYDVIDPLGSIYVGDTVVVPANVTPGSYYLGIVIDPEDEVYEFAKENNSAVWCDRQADGTCAPIPIEVVASSFRIVTQSLPIVTVGQSYDVQLLAAGGAGGYQWRVSSGGLPEGLALDSSGLIHGTVAEQGDHVFRVTANAGALSASATFAIRVMPAGGPLVITAVRLPAAYTNTAYVAALAASGGTSPHAWSCDGLPTWAWLDGSIISGTPLTAADAVAVTCTVTDASQQTVSAAYALQVLVASNLRIESTAIGTFDRDVASSATIEAVGGSGSYRWTIDEATLPTGLHAEEAGDTGVIEGTPTVCGNFLVGVTVADAVTGVTDSAKLPLVVVCDAPRLTTRDLPVAVRGQDYPETQLNAERAKEFVIVLGELPRGLALSKAGTLSGKVAIDAETGDHNVAIELRDGAGGTGLGALTIAVRSPGQDFGGVDKVSKGCSASGEGSAADLLPLVALSALIGLRWRRGKAAGTILAAALAAVAPTAASAQGAGYGMVSWDIEYQRLEGATPGAGCSSYPADTCISPAIQLPFTFTFFDAEYDRIWLDSNGVLHFINATSYTANVAIPNTAAPNGFIAPWWDDLEVAAADDIRYLVRGVAPNREFVVEFLLRWYADSHTGKDLAEMQVSLYEGNYFAIRWGSPGLTGVHNASVGIEDATGSSRSMAILACTPNCVQADWEAHLKNKEMLFSSGVNLSIVETSAPPEVLAGSEYEFRVWVRNSGLTEISAPVEFYISRNLEISRDDHFIGRTPFLDFGVGEAVQEDITAPLPKSLAPGAYYLLARVDPDDAVEEFREVDNDGGAFRFVVLEPMPDLAVAGIAAPPSGWTGSWIAVDLEIVNLGNVDVRGVPYWILLSDNEVISEFDRVIHRGFLDIGANSNTTIGALAELQAGTPAGVYHLGVMIDPENAVLELDELNNVRAWERKITLINDGLRVLTQLPATLQVGAPYCVPLEAEGGDGVLTWAVEGMLPPGLVFDPGGEGDSDGAWICGAATEAGIYDFIVALTSGGVTRRTEVSLEVIVVPLELGVATRDLPIGSFNVPYEAGLSANGGRSPYRWELLSGELPAGLTLDADGLIYGMPLVDGEFSLEVQVHDGDDHKAAASVGLRITSPGWITCSTRTLGAVKVGSELGGRLLAGGGTGSYVWTSLRTERFGDPGAPDLVDEEGPPPGIELRASGLIEGAPAQVGRYLWTVEVSDELLPENTDTCTISLEVLPGPGLTVATTAMPIALVDEEYVVQLRAAGGDGSYRWTLVDPRSLPTGLGLGVTGIVSGRLAEADLDGDESRTWSFLVEVRDGQNNVGTGAMSVTLTKRKDGATVPWRTEESGCSTGGGASSLVALGLVVLGLRRRHLLSALVAAIVLVGCDDTKISTKLVTEDVCARLNIDCDDPSGAITCDPADGLCKCGGKHGNGLVCGWGQECVIDETVTPASPSCVSGLCGKACGRYETCDPLDGLCKCGGVQCAPGFTCIEGVCEDEDPCDGIICGDGQICDPADKICKCGSEICSVGESCRTGQGGASYCVGRRCVGLNCPEGTECNPADGLCHCGGVGGPVCTAGQACLVDDQTGDAYCAGDDICEGVICHGGTTCSPLDGRCRCGGFDNAAPVCGSKQTCDQASRRCVGGNLCADVECVAGSNLSCDDEEGICKCGGQGGVVCEGEEGCVTGADVEFPACVKRCSPLRANVEIDVCGADPSQSRMIGCYFGPESAIAFCATAGLAGDGKACERITDCAAGYHCVASADGGVCRHYCDASPSAATTSCYSEETKCIALSAAQAVVPNLGVCMTIGP